MTEPFVIGPGEGRGLDLGTFQVVVLATAEQTEGRFSLLQTRNEPPGFGPPLHRHRDAAEAFYVLAGEYVMHLEGREQRCPPGTFVYVPRNVAHTFEVVSAQPGTKLNIFAPSAMVGFFEELAAAHAAGDTTAETVESAAARHHMQVLGPVPETYV